MRRPAAVALTAMTASMSLLLAGCGSSTPAPAAASAASAPSSTTAASSTTAKSSSAAPSYTDSSAPAGGNLGLAAWSSAFCTALTPLTTLSKLPTPDTSTLATARTSFVSYFTQYSIVLGQIVAGLDTVGPPPGGGSVATAADALNASAGTVRDLTATLSATDPANASALAAVISKAADEVTVLGTTFTALDKSLPAEIKASLDTTPECKPLAS